MAVTPSALNNSFARLLIVDDEPHIRIPMGEVLRLRGFRVDEVANGAEALATLERASYDVMMLDMVMPGLHGVEVMRRARQLRPDLIIIVLTAHATVESAIASVKSDVTDYMLKPCNVDDLAVTINRALQERSKQLKRQRMLELVGEAMNMLQDTDDESTPESMSVPAATPDPAPIDGNTLRVGSLTLDRGKRLAIVEEDMGRPIELTEGEVAVLDTLMQHPNQVMSLGQLADSALGYQGMDKWTVESVVRSCVFRLRQKIEMKPDNPKYICTVRGRGYFFRASQLGQPDSG